MARLSAEQWTMARADFEIAGMSVTEIAQKYGCAKSDEGEGAGLGTEQN